MASATRPFDPKNQFSQQLMDALAFVNWAKEETKLLQNDHATASAVYELALECYEDALDALREHVEQALAAA